MTRISKRGQGQVDSPAMPPYIMEHFERATKRRRFAEDPEGYIALCIAENKLQAPRLSELLAQYEVSPEVLGYDAPTGNFAFRDALSAFMGRTFLGRQFPREQIAVVAGAGSVLEMVFYGLGDPGQGVLVPTPSYAGFWPDIETRDELQVVPVPLSADDGFELTTTALDAAIDGAACEVKALLFTNPSNPLGCIYPREKVAEIVEWSRARGIHLVADEIYALSAFGDERFVSVAEVTESLGDDVHIVWAFSKDFGASGLRCGALVTENESLMRVVGSLAYWSVVSGHTQSLLRQLISDPATVDAYLEASQASLRSAHAQVLEGLERLGVPAFPATAAFFVFCDFRKYLSAPTWEAEEALWRRVLDEANVNLTPGAACRMTEPGFFRLCYAAEPPEALAAAMDRIARVLG